MSASAPATSRIVLPDGGLLAQVPVTPTLIVATCMICREERPASEHRDGACLDCRVGKALAPLFDRLVELLRKQNRYASRHLPSMGTPDQVGRQLRRMWKVIQNLVVDRTRQREFLSRAIERAQQVAA